MTPDAGDRPLAVGDVLEVEVRGIASGGAGVTDLPDGRVAFVQRTAPGDRARVRVTGLKRSWGRGELLEVLEPSRARREPPCTHYGRCGGCTLEHLRYVEQLRWKGRLVRDALVRIGGFEDVEAPGVVPSPSEFRYRNRVTFHLRRLDGGRVVAGFHELERPGRVIDLDGRCLLPEEPLSLVWDDLREAWGPGAERLPSGRGLRLTLRRVERGALLLVEPDDRHPELHDADREHASALVDAIEGLVAVWWLGGERPELLAGAPDAEERWHDRRLRLGPTTFLQVNREAAEILQDAVARELGLPDRVGSTRRALDAYAGVGEYGRRLAAAGVETVAVELDASAAAAARAGAPSALTVLEGRVEERLHEALPVDLAVLNPPRTGLHEDVPEALLRQPPRRIVYVSCDPATLARDLGRLGGRYRISRLQAFDLFPQTAHVETVVTLDRRDAHGPDAGTASDDPHQDDD